MFKKYKNDIWWIIITLLIILFLNIAYMYSRDKTLSIVEKNQFKLFINIMHTTSLNHKNFKQMTNSLTIKRHGKRQALFHIALITKKGCIENAEHERNEPLLCNIFKSNTEIRKIIKDKAQKYKYKGQIKKSYEYSVKDLGINESAYQVYMIKKRNNTNKWIIGKKRYLSTDSELSKITYFLSNRYFQKTSLHGKFRNTEYATYIILLVSFLLWLWNKLLEYRRIIKYDKFKKMKFENQKKIQVLEDTYNEKKIKHYELERKILGIEKDLIDTLNPAKEYKEKQLEEIGYLRKEEGALIVQIEQDKKQIIELERNSFRLENNLTKEREKLKEYVKDIEYKKLGEASTQLKLLWRHEPSWIERHNIEQATSLKKTNLPFTLTQGFIAFENYVDAEVKRLDTSDMLLQDTTFNLYAKIDYIVKTNHLSGEDKRRYHDIRKARNKWFHSAIYPDIKLMASLVELLNEKKVDIIL
jgi:hypothetical protein